MTDRERREAYERIADILRRYDAGEKLKDHELMVVQMERNGFGCHVCGVRG